MKHKLPPLEPGQLTLKTVTPSQHFTEPPPRFTKRRWSRLEERGIGRPSTYRGDPIDNSRAAVSQKIGGKFRRRISGLL